jgi:hypothetical protein
MLSLKKIPGGSKVKPIHNPNQTTASAGGLFPQKFSNILLVSKKASGKTSLVFHMLKKLCTKNTITIIFCPTVKKDPAYTHNIIPWLDEHDRPYHLYTSLEDHDEDNENGESVKDELMDFFKHSEQQHGKKITQFIMILDDLGDECRDKFITGLAKKNRHYFLNLIVSVQYVHDVLPGFLKQVDSCFLSQGNSEDKLLMLKQSLDLSISDADFLRIYKKATEERFKFLNIDRNHQKFYRDFTDEIIPDVPHPG